MKNKVRAYVQLLIVVNDSTYWESSTRLKENATSLHCVPVIIIWVDKRDRPTTPGTK